MSTIKQLLDTITPDTIKALNPYQSASRDWQTNELWLNANESPFSDFYQLDTSTYNRYPEFQPPALLQRYADYAGVTPEQVIAGRGADEGIEMLIRACCQPGQDSILICPPTYGMYAVSAATFGINVQKQPLNDDFTLNTTALTELAASEQSTGIKLVFLCSPNNPTGNPIPLDDIRQVASAFADKALVVVDEAYFEFNTVTDSATSLFKDCPNVVVLRTLSKAFSLAGIRCGFTLAVPDVIQLMRKVSSPYPIPQPVAQIATEVLSSAGLARIQDRILYLNEQKAVLQQALSTLHFVKAVYPSEANFLLVATQNPTRILDLAADQGILLRNMTRQPGLEDCIRISIGSQDENQQLLELLTRIQPLIS